MSKRLICSVQNDTEGYHIEVFEKDGSQGYVAEIVTWEEDWGTGNRLGATSHSTQEVSETNAYRMLSRLNSEVKLSGRDYDQLWNALQVKLM